MIASIVDNLVVSKMDDLALPHRPVGIGNDFLPDNELAVGRHRLRLDVDDFGDPFAAKA